MAHSVTISGTGSYVPKKVLTNHDLEAIVDTTDEWISTRTGIKERRIASDTQSTSDLATEAARSAMADANVSGEEIDLIIVATISPDAFFPATACYVQQNIEATNALCFDVSAACSGFLYAMQIAENLILSGQRKTALIIGAEKLSSMVDWEDRNTCVLFGDGAGSVILTVDENNKNGRKLLSSSLGSDGRQTDILHVPGGGSACPITPENADQKLNTIRMQGREVYKYAVNAMRRAAEDALQKYGLGPEDVDMVIPHQANLRIIEAITDRMGIPKEKTFINLTKYGNTSAAAVAIALDEANKTKSINEGDTVLLVAFGAGLTWASYLLKW
ncbi:MAG: beta-ketoacyl-ACP synthase III [Verrucomicrobiota bacterium]|nr:beta-ketoacyl-ACP synthase III [Verrucomicrobiota bacterium]MEE2967795.1 beta-ketoacyl-ACP synthase III [Verrucomicrobiota bacterium]